MGRKLTENRGQRGKFQIKHIESYNPIKNERQIVYQEGKPKVDIPAVTVTSADVLARAQSLPNDKITLNFLTPTRILSREKLVHHAAFLPLVQRLLERLTALEQAYGIEEAQESTPTRRELVDLAGQIECCDDSTHWEDVLSHSQRQNRTTPIGGIVGQATFKGNLAPFRELLVWGELIHVGKNAVKGKGGYRIEN